LQDLLNSLLKLENVQTSRLVTIFCGFMKFGYVLVMSVPLRSYKAWVFNQLKPKDLPIRSKAISLFNLQQNLQDIYELELGHNVNDYLITNQILANSLGHKTLTDIKEKLLVCQDNEDLLLTLYLHEDVVNNLHKNDPSLALHNGNLEDFCLALEGISHFIYLLWNASYERSVTLLEMELQAEIDKFVMCAMYMEQQCQYLAPGVLRQKLFEAVSFHQGLAPDELQRYRDANNYGEKILLVSGIKFL